MTYIKSSQLLLVGSNSEKQYFQQYFKDIKLLNTNSEVLDLYRKESSSTIFLNCDSREENVFSICSTIRKNDNHTVIVLITNTISINQLQKALPLHLSGYIERPFHQNKVQKVLSNIEHDLELLFTNIIKLKDGYYFNIKQQILYNATYSEIKLTKNELTLLNIFIKSKNEIVTEEYIEYKVWEEESLTSNCSNRLKNLLYNLRKKLPEGSISNYYKLGYKLIY